MSPSVQTQENAVPLEWLSFVGMQDGVEGSVGKPRLAKRLENVYPVAPEEKAGVVGRPGFVVLGAQLGAAGAREVQRLYQYTKLDGTEYTLAFCGGKMYSLNWGTRAWTEKSLVGVSLPSSGRIYCATFADKLIVNPNDGVNKPWMWDGTTFTELSNAPLLWGPITVYYAKLFGIKWTERNVLVWSEENDPSTGYESGTYNNAWTLGQTEQEALTCILGTNELLYYWRERSSGAISGRVTPDFSTTGTHEGVDQVVGTKSPDAVVLFNETIYWPSADAQPYFMRTGGFDPESLEPYVRETLKEISKVSLHLAVGVGDARTKMVLQGQVALTGQYPDNYIAIDSRSNLIGGLWTGWTATALDAVKDESGRPVLLHGSDGGYVYEHGRVDGNYWDDAFVAGEGGSAAIKHQVIASAQDYDEREEYTFDRVDVTLVLQSNVTLLLDYNTPRGTGGNLSGALTHTGARWDVAKWDVDVWSKGAYERHIAFGIEGWGRWIQPTVTHQQAGEQFTLLGIKVDAYPIGAEVEAL